MPDFFQTVKEYLQAFDRMLQTRFWFAAIMIINVLFFATDTFGAMLEDESIFIALIILNAITFWQNVLLLIGLAVIIIFFHFLFS